MHIILPIVGIVLLGFIIKEKLGIEAGFTIFLSVSTIILLLLIGGSINILYFTRISVYIGIFGYGIITLVKNKKNFKEYCMSPAVIMFAVSTIGLSIIYTYSDTFYYIWEDFATWGPFYKSVFTDNRLLQFSQISMAHPDYPQGMTVLYYYTALTTRNFLEAHTYASVNVMLAASATTLLAYLKWKKPLYTLVIMACIPLFYVLFPYTQPYISVCLETTLGAAFGAVLLMIATIPKQRKNYIAAWVGMAAMVQIKPTGIVLAGISLVYFALQLWFSDAEQGIKYAMAKNMNIKTAKNITIGIIFVAISYSYWKIFVHITSSYRLNIVKGRQAVQQSNFSIKEMVWGIFSADIKQTPVTFNSFGTSLVTAVVLTLTGIIIGILLVRKEKLWGPSISCWVTPILFIGYIFSYFYLYMAVDKSGNIVSGFSFQNHISIFIIGWSMLLLGVCLFYGKSLFFSKLPNLVPVVAILGILLLQANTILQKNLTSFEEEQKNRDELDNVSEQLLEQIQPNDSIWLIAQGDDGQYRAIYHYTLLPADVSLTLPYNIDTKLKTEQLKEMAFKNNIDYILINRVDNNFRVRFGYLFSDNLNSVIDDSFPSLYKVEANNATVPFTLVVATTE